MNVTVRENQSISIIAIQGEITMYDIKPISDAINKLVSQEKYMIVFDFSKVGFIDSSGIGMILRSMINLVKLGGMVHVFACISSVEKIMKVSLKNTPAQIFQTEQEAIEACKNLK